MKQQKVYSIWFLLALMVVGMFLTTACDDVTEVGENIDKLKRLQEKVDGLESEKGDALDLAKTLEDAGTPTTPTTD